MGMEWFAAKSPTDFLNILPASKDKLCKGSRVIMRFERVKICYFFL